MSICPKRAARIPIMLPVFLNTIIWSKVLYWIINIQRNMETEVPLYCHHCACWHYSDVTMDAIVSQITSLTIVYSTVLFRRRSKKTSKLCVTGLCVGNSPWTGEFPAQMASNAENVSIWWRHHDGLAPLVATVYAGAVMTTFRSRLHYSDVIMSAMASQSSASRSFAQSFVQA